MNGPTFKALAFAYASRLKLNEVQAWFSGKPAISQFKTHILAVWGEHEMAFAFDFGALVFVNVRSAIRNATLEAFMLGLDDEPHPPLREELIVEVRRGARVELGFDRVRVPGLTTAACEVIATVIAQSACLDYYEEDIHETLDRIQDVASQLALDGKLPRRATELVKLVGASIASRVEIIRSLGLLDKPDAAWDDALSDELFDKLRAAFEIPDRYRAIEAKLTASRAAVAAFLEMMQHRRSLLLEAAIVALIVVEIVLGLLKIQ